MTCLALEVPRPATTPAVALLLNAGHAIDHMFLLTFAAAVGTIAVEFGLADWTDRMPYGVGAALLTALARGPRQAQRGRAQASAAGAAGTCLCGDDGRLIDRSALKPLYLWITLAQVPLLALAAQAQGWWLLAMVVASTVFIFGAIPFTDAMIVRHADDADRSRVAGMGLTLSNGISSLAVWLLGPIVKSLGFDAPPARRR